MGYRSEVVSAIAMPSLDFVYELAAKYKLQQGEEWRSFSHLLDNSIVRTQSASVYPWIKEKSGYTELPEGCLWYIWEFHITDWKWYDGYPEVDMWHNIIRQLAGEKGLYSVFVRLGEDEGDIEQETYEPDSSYEELQEYI